MADAARPLVSVIIPTYDRAALTAEAVASVQAQTYPNAEIIVVDDGSGAADRAALEGLTGITLIRQENGGSASARNAGLAAATGAFIASLDSDDLWHPTFLERCVGALEGAQLDVVFANWQRAPAGPSWLDNEAAAGRLDRFGGTLRDAWTHLTPAAVRNMFLRACPAPSSSLLIRRSAMRGGWNERTLVGDDWYLLLEIVLGSEARAAYTLEPLWTKRVDGQNKYDGSSPADIARNLFVHDLGLFRRDFASQLTARERRLLARRHALWHARLGYLHLRGKA